MKNHEVVEFLPLIRFMAMLSNILYLPVFVSASVKLPCTVSSWSVVDSYNRKYCKKKHSSLWSLFSAWSMWLRLFSATLAYMVEGSREIDPPYGFCGRDPYSRTFTVQLVKMVTWAFLPTLITVIFHCKIYRLLQMETNRQLRRGADKQRRVLTSSSADLLNRSQRKVVRRMRILEHRIVAIIILKCLGHYPIAFFYLMKKEEQPEPVTNLIVLLIHFSSTVFNAVRLFMIYSAPKKHCLFLEDRFRIQCSTIKYICTYWVIQSTHLGTSWLRGSGNEEALSDSTWEPLYVH